MGWRTTAVALGVLCASTNCAWIMMEDIGKNYSPIEGAPRCTSTRAFSVWDVLLGSANAAVGVYLVSTDVFAGPGEDKSTAGLGAVSLAVGMAHFLSAASGSGKAKNCVRANELYVRHAGGGGDAQQRRRRSPRALGDGGQGCYPNKTCNRGFTCNEFRGVCVRGSGSGKIGGPCYPNQTCDAGLDCTDERCSPPGTADEPPQ